MPIQRITSLLHLIHTVDGTLDVTPILTIDSTHGVDIIDPNLTLPDSIPGHIVRHEDVQPGETPADALNRLLDKARAETHPVIVYGWWKDPEPTAIEFHSYALGETSAVFDGDFDTEGGLWGGIASVAPGEKVMDAIYREIAEAVNDETGDDE